MKHALFDHNRLWFEHARKLMDGEPGIYDGILKELAREGYNATVDFPNCIYYTNLTQQYPHAKVILSLRSNGEGKEYAESVMSTIAQIVPLLRRAPLRWYQIMQRVEFIHEWFFSTIDSPLNELTGLPDPENLAKSYDDWAREVQETVDSEQLLVFRAKDGWKPLCDFLSPLHITVQQRCDEIIGSNEPYPHVNGRQTFSSALAGLRFLAISVECSPLLLLISILWYALTKGKERVKRKRC